MSIEVALVGTIFTVRIFVCCTGAVESPNRSTRWDVIWKLVFACDFLTCSTPSLLSKMDCENKSYANDICIQLERSVLMSGKQTLENCTDAALIFAISI